ncbi:MAG: DUF115 domain-containing protein [Treponema sp.]|nr:DUF115 domain-containing protein [Treponema sp.]
MRRDTQDKSGQRQIGAGFIRNGITLLSGVDPVRSAERTADVVSIKDRTLYFCPSPLYGYGLKRLLERLETEAQNSAVLCIEADPELYELALKNIDASFTNDSLENASPNIKLRITDICDAEKICAFVHEVWGVRAFRRLETIKFTGGWQLFPQLYDSLCDALRREIATDWSNAMTLAKLGRLYIRNAIRNLSLIPHFPSIANLSFGETPVLVLGAGPSLDETLDFLDRCFSQTFRQPQSRPFKIVCVDTCLGALKDRNIIPDIVVILESQHWNLKDFTGCRGWNIPAAVDLSALPCSAKILEGEGFLFMTPWTHLRIFERLKAAGLLPSVIPPLGSVGLTAVELARRISRGKIILSGIDFSFTTEKYHARSTPGHRGKLNTQTRFHAIANTSAFAAASFAAVSKSGISVYSSPVMRNYRDLFEREFGSDPRLFDVEGSGLSLGIKTLSPEEAVAMLAEDIFNHEPSRTCACGTDRNRGEDNQEVVQSEEEKKLLIEKLLTFFDNEKSRLNELRDILTGDSAADHARLNALIEECDYLWAHFPDYSGGGRRPGLEEIASGSEVALSFLRRLRAEIDPMLKLMERCSRY